MKIKELLEEFELSFKLQGFTFEIISTPLSSKEMDSLSEELNGKRYIRFIAVPSTKKTYFFSPEIMHGSATILLKKEKGVVLKPESSLFGVAEKSGKSWKVVEEESKRLISKMSEDTKNSNLDFLKRYVVGVEKLF